MLISEIEKNPIEALNRMERVVNDGPPTGLKFTNNVSLHTNPWLYDDVEIDKANCPKGNLRIIGEEPLGVKRILGETGIFVHPDFRELCEDGNLYTKRVISGCPTSSSRTIRIEKLQCYVKLHYPGILGRVDKSLSENDIINSIDVTNLLQQAICRERTSPLLSFYPEKSGRIGICGESRLSFTIRDTKPYGKNANCIRYIVPAFSIYGQDYEAPLDDILLTQLIRNNIGIGNNYVDKLLIPIVDCYLSLLFYEGLQHEMHSQNFLLGFDKGWNLCAIILRDIESVQKDMTIRNDQGITDSVKSYPSRCLWRGQINYEEKHSFMYDHKLYDFFIRPLIEKVDIQEQQKKEALSAISTFVREKYRDQINEYFPSNGKWYKFEDVIVSNAVKRRLFLECDKPMLR